MYGFDSHHLTIFTAMQVLNGSGVFKEPVEIFASQAKGNPELYTVHV